MTKLNARKCDDSREIGHGGLRALSETAEELEHVILAQIRARIIVGNVPQCWFITSKILCGPGGLAVL